MPIFGRPSRQTALRSKLLHFTRTSERSCRVQRACVWAGVHEKDRARAPRKPRGGRLERARVRAPLQCRMQRHCRREVHGREGPLCAGREAPCAGNRRVRERCGHRGAQSAARLAERARASMLKHCRREPVEIPCAITVAWIRRPGSSARRSHGSRMKQRESLPESLGGPQRAPRQSDR